MLRALAALLLAAVAAAATVETQHFVVSAQDNGTAAAAGRLLEEAYSYYSSMGLQPAPPCDGAKYPVEVSAASQDAGDTYVDEGSRCIVNLTLKRADDRHVAYHEVAHIFQVRYASSLYRWPVEAIPEAMASMASGQYRSAASYFWRRLWTVNPDISSRSDWYSYSAAFVWYLAGRRDWGAAVAEASSRPDSVYVGFLLALARGVQIGGERFAPQFESLTLLGYLVLDPPGDVLTAAYYNISLSRPGYVVIEAEGPVASNLALNRPFYVDNGTLLLALVRNGTSPARVRISYWLYISVLGGSYIDGNLTLELYARYMESPLTGQLYINGTPVYFSGGRGTYSLRGGLRPYVLVASYGGVAAAVRLDLSPPRVAVRPALLYLGEGGGGALEVLVNNTGPISLSCRLSASAPGGISFGEARLEAPPGGVGRAALPFSVVGRPSGPVEVSCAGASAAVEVRPLWHSLRYDADAGHGNLTTPLGTYQVGPLPAAVNVTTQGYTAAVLRLAPPVVAVEVGRPRFDLDHFVFPLTVLIRTPPNSTFLGTVYVDGAALRRVAVAGVAVVAANVTATAAREVEVRFGAFSNATRLVPPQLKVELVPVRAVVNGSRVALLVRAVYSVDVVRLELRCDPRPAAAQGDLLLFVVDYAEEVTVGCSGPAQAVASVHLPRPNLSAAPLDVSVSPEEVRAVLNLTASVCGPSVNSTYQVAAAGGLLTVEVPRGGCGVGWRLAEAKAPYAPEVRLSVETSFGAAAASLHVPPPSVDVSLVLWSVEGAEERALVGVVARAPPNYSYTVLGRAFRGLLNATVELEARSGTVVVDYGFGRAIIARPRLEVEAPPAVAPLGRPLNLTLVVRAPAGLRLSARLEVANRSLPVRLSPGESRRLSVPLDSPPSPGVYVLPIRLGPYSAEATAVWASASLRLEGPRLLPVGARALVRLAASVTPPVAVNATVEASGCFNGLERAAPNSTLSFIADRPCVLRLSAAVLDARAEAEVEWASLVASVEVERLGVLNGLPVFAAGSLRPAAYLGGRPVEAVPVVHGDLAALGYVSLNVTVEYMGVRNSTAFRGYAVPRGAYLAAQAALRSMPADAAAAFRLMVDAAVVTGSWGAVEDVAALYGARPTPMALLARFLVERQLASGRPPDVRLAEGLLAWEVPIYGVGVGLTSLGAAVRLLRRQRYTSTEA